MRYRVIAAVIFIVALVGAKATLGIGPSPTNAEVAPPATALPTSTPNSTGPWEISGTIQQMNGEFWEIQGFAIRVTGSTQVTGDLPSNGVFVRAQGIVDTDGTWLATRVWVGAATTPTATTPPATSEAAAPSATATTSATATPTAAVTLTPSATPVPPTATRSPTATVAHRAASTKSPPTATPVPQSPSRPGGHSHPGHGKKG